MVRNEKKKVGKDMRQKLMRKTFHSEQEFRHYRDQLHQCLKEVLGNRGENSVLLDNDVTLLEIALNEAVNNAFKYALDKVATPAVTLSMYLFQSKFLLIRVKDNGSGFRADQVLAKVSALDKEAEKEWEWGESGRGIFIMEAVMDKVRYNAKGNSVMLLKTLSYGEESLCQ